MLTFTFTNDISMTEVQQTFYLALLTVEILHGAERVAMDVDHSFEPHRRQVCIGTDNAIGQALGLVFHGFVRREFGQRAISVCRVQASLATVGGTA